MQDLPAGWYRDTERPNLHRYWTGERWSERFGEELVARRPEVPQQLRRGDELIQQWAPAQVASDAAV